MHFEQYYLGLSLGATLLFCSSSLNVGPLAALSPATSTGVVVTAFTVLTVVHFLVAR